MRKSYENYLLDTDITMNNNFFEITMYRTEINILLIVKLTPLLISKILKVECNIGVTCSRSQINYRMGPF